MARLSVAQSSPNLPNAERDRVSVAYGTDIIALCGASASVCDAEDAYMQGPCHVQMVQCEFAAHIPPFSVAGGGGPNAARPRGHKQALLDRVPVLPAHIHPILCDGSPADAARRYETLLRGLFEPGPPRFDLVFLGLGENGHTASLFPGNSISTQRWIADVRVPGEDFCRITMTPLLINQASCITFLIVGTKKAQTLSEIFIYGKSISQIPAKGISPINGNLLWYVDEAAAGKLDRK